MSARRTSFEADRDSCFCTVDDDDAGGVVSLVTEWDRIRNFGVVMGESEGYFGESGGVREVCWGIFCFFCEGGRI